MQKQTAHTRMTLSWLLALCLLGGLIVVQPVWADGADEIAKWEALGQGEKDQLRENFKVWKNLPADERQRVQENFRKFSNLSENERERVLDNYSLFKSMDRTQRKVIYKRYQKWQNLTPEQQALLKERYQMLLDLNPDEQAQFYENYRTWKRLAAERKQELISKWSALTPSKREALKKKYGKAFSRERRQEIKRILKKIRKNRLDRE